MTSKQFELSTTRRVPVQNLVLSVTFFQNLKVIRYTILVSVAGNDSQYLLRHEAGSLDRPRVEVTEDLLQHILMLRAVEVADLLQLILMLRAVEEAGHRAHDL